MPDQLEHFVSFRSSGKAWRFSDSPTELEEPETQEDLVAQLKKIAHSSTETAVENALKAMLEAIAEDDSEADGSAGIQEENPETEIDSARERLAINQFMKSERSNLAKAEFIARTYFDAQLLTLQTEA